MASGKEMSMLFQLRAQMDGSYNSTFSSAKEQITALEEEIHTLSSLQSDISAYEKQQQAVDNTRSKLEMLQQQYANIETEIQNTEGFSSSLQNQLLSKQQQIDKTSAALETQTQKLNEMGTALQEAGVDTSDLTGESQRLEQEMENVKTAQEEVAESAEDVADSSEEMGDKSTSAINDMAEVLATSAIASALNEIVDAFKECINVAASFESTMSSVQAISGATSEEMDELTACAKELGSTTAYTAQESAEAMTYMAMAGWETEDMLSGMQGVMDLAAASGEDLAEVSDIVTDAMTAFGMEASESAHFADVLAATASNSNTSVSQMGETFKNVAPLAGTLGYSIEDVSVLMGLMADNGIKSSVAGTALKNTLNGLVDGCTLTCDALGDYEISAMNSDGTSKDLSDTIDELRWAFSQMSQEEQVANAQAIAGERSYNGLLAILNSTDEQYDDLTQSINECSGAASEMAEIKMDNMTGSLTLMQSAWEGLKITIGEQFTPALSKLYDMLANVIGWLDKFIEENPIIIKLLAALVAGVAAFAVGLGVYTAAVKIAQKATEAFNDSLKANVIVGVATAVVGVVSALVLFATTAKDDGLPALEDLTESAQALSDTMDEVSTTYNDSVASAESAADAAEGYIDRLFELQDEGLETAEAQDEFNATCALLLETMPELADLIEVTTDEYGNLSYALNGTKEDFYDLTEAEKEHAIAEAYNQAVADSYEAYAQAVIDAKTQENLLADATEQVETAEKNRTNTINEISAALEDSCGYTYDELEGMGLLEGQIGNLDQKYIDMYNSIDEYNDEISEGRAAMERYGDSVDIYNEALAEAEEQMHITEEAYGEYKEEIDAAAAAEEEAAAQQEELNAQVDNFSGYMEGVIGQIEDLTQAYNDAYDAAYSSVSGQYSLWDEAAEVTATSAEKINKNMEGQIEYWQNYNSNLEKLNDRADDIDGLSDVIASFADGSADSVNAVAGMADATDEELAKMVENYQMLQDEEVTVSDSIALMVSDYEAQMEDLLNTMNADIEAMNMSDEATAASKETLQAYIDQANDMEPLVGSAYESVAFAANAALNSIAKSFTVSLSTSGSTATINTSYRAKGYATGTEDAAKGLAIVGEEGPELVNFNGGEQVIPNDETKQLLSMGDQDINAYAEGTVTDDLNSEAEDAYRNAMQMYLDATKQLQSLTVPDIQVEVNPEVELTTEVQTEQVSTTPIISDEQLQQLMVPIEMPEAASAETTITEYVQPDSEIDQLMALIEAIQPQETPAQVKEPVAQEQPTAVISDGEMDQITSLLSAFEPSVQQETTNIENNQVTNNETAQSVETVVPVDELDQIVTLLSTLQVEPSVQEITNVEKEQITNNNSETTQSVAQPPTDELNQIITLLSALQVEPPIQQETTNIENNQVTTNNETAQSIEPVQPPTDELNQIIALLSETQPIQSVENVENVENETVQNSESTTEYVIPDDDLQEIIGLLQAPEVQPELPAVVNEVTTATEQIAPPTDELDQIINLLMGVEPTETTVNNETVQTVEPADELNRIIDLLASIQPVENTTNQTTNQTNETANTTNETTNTTNTTNENETIINNEQTVIPELERLADILSGVEIEIPEVELSQADNETVQTVEPVDELNRIIDLLTNIQPIENTTNQTTSQSSETNNTTNTTNTTNNATTNETIINNEQMIIPELQQLADILSGIEVEIPEAEPVQVNNEVTQLVPDESTEITAILPQLISALSDSYGTDVDQPMPESIVESNETYQSNNNVSVTINVSGNVTQDTMQELQDYADDFAERVRAVVEEIEDDRLRGAYT